MKPCACGCRMPVSETKQFVSGHYRRSRKHSAGRARLIYLEAMELKEIERRANMPYAGKERNA